ncbi:MAG: FG-GAP-like repeat-containing protein [Pirellulales bacterium]|nr:FG-GAP-like repeat-containing protein [Pirellulales bacterium]
MVFSLAVFAGCDSTDHRSPSSTQSSRSGTGAERAETLPETDGLAWRAGREEAGESSASSDREGVIAQADALVSQARFSEAADLLTNLLIVDPEDVEVIFRMATVAAAEGNLAAGIELLNKIPEEHPEAGLAAQGQAADWCFSLHRYDEAESRYRKILARAPDAVPALRQLAFLLNRQGRRQEASQLVQKLCLLGNVLQDELHSLIAISDAMYDDPVDKTASSQQAASSRADRQYLPISPYGDARKAFQDGRYQEAMDLLKPKIEDATAPAAMVALFGRAAGEAQDDAMVAWWLSRLPAQVTDFADYWATLGLLELMGQRYQPATGALGEALRRDPTDLASLSRMRQAFGSMGKEKEAQLWFERWTQTRASLDANNRVAEGSPPEAQSIESLASALEALDRPLEAVLWRAIGAAGKSGSGDLMLKLNQQHKELLENGNAFPSLASRWCGLDLQDFPLPQPAQWLSESAVEADRGNPSGDHKVIPASFTNLADSIGLTHTYRVAGQPLQRHYAIYQTLGGGVAVVDYDLDGWPDLYFAQGGADPPHFRSENANQLYRNLQSTLGEVTVPAGVSVSRYSLGVAAGDWNQDGFADLAISNIGAGVLLINNGDGTFTERPLEARVNADRVPASIAIADVTGDHLPDVVQIGYVDDANMTVKPPLDDDGRVTITVAPGNFSAAVDYLFQNNGDGSWGDRSLTGKANSRTGLGLIIGDFDQEPGNEIFIGNDSMPNRLWKLGSQDQPLDLATIYGCAYGFSGGATGAMGIAVGDFDQNSKMDLHVTNYENENANLYLKRGKVFQDRNVQYRLGRVSRNLVGFGTQAIDYDNDGDSDLIVTNGHLDDAKSIRGTFTQPIQLLRNMGQEFRPIDVHDPSGYWPQRHVGRGLATLDFNRDGQTDVVVTHVEERSALLINQTNVGHHWLQVALVGTQCERDAVGARIEVQFNDQVWTCWNVAGDGYLSGNESLVHFGLGGVSRVQQLRVHWPNGQVQTFDDPPADRRFLVIEAEPTLFELK